MAIREKTLTLLFMLLCSTGALFLIWQVRNWDNELPLVDRYSEASLRWGWHAVCLTGMVATSLWFVVMGTGIFLWRHWFLMFLFMVLFDACRIRVEAANARRLLHRGSAVSWHGL